MPDPDPEPDPDPDPEPEPGRLRLVETPRTRANRELSLSQLSLAAFPGLFDASVADGGAELQQVEVDDLVEWDDDQMEWGAQIAALEPEDVGRLLFKEKHRTAALLDRVAEMDRALQQRDEELAVARLVAEMKEQAAEDAARAAKTAQEALEAQPGEHYNVTVQRLREAHTVEIAYLLHLPQEMTVLRASHEQEREEAAGVELARQRLTEEHGAEDAEKEQHVAGLEQYVLEQAEQLGALQSEHEALVIDQAAAVASAAEMLASTIAHSAALDTALQSELGQARTEQAASVEAARQQAAASIEAAVAEQATEAAAYEEVRTLFWHFVVYCLTLWSFHHFSLRYLTFRTHIWWEWMSRSCWQRVRATWRGSKLSARKRRRWRRLQPVRARRLRWRCAGRWTR